MARTQQSARKPKNKKQKKGENTSEGENAIKSEQNTTESEPNTTETQEEEEIKEEEKKSEEVESIQEGNNAEGEETIKTEQTKEETKETTEENKENSDSTVKNLLMDHDHALAADPSMIPDIKPKQRKPASMLARLFQAETRINELTDMDFHKARRTLYIHFPPGPIGESGMEMLDTVYQNNGKLVLPQQVCFAAFPSEEIVDQIKPKLEEFQVNGKPLTVKYMGAKGTDMDDPCINPYRLKLQGLLVHPDEKLVGKKFPKGKVTQTIKKLKSVTLDFNTKEDASEALKLAKGLKFGDKPVRVSYVREASENWMEEFMKRKAEREAAESPSKKQKLDDETKNKKEAEEDDKKVAEEEGENEEMADGEGEGEENEGEESEGDDEGEDEGEGEGEEEESEGGGEEESEEVGDEEDE